MQLADIVTMAAAVPDILIAVDASKTVLASNKPLDKILAATAVTGETSGSKVIDFAQLSDSLAADIGVAMAEEGAQKVLKPAEEYKAGSILCENCVGYEVIPLPKKD